MTKYEIIINELDENEQLIKNLGRLLASGALCLDDTPPPNNGYLSDLTIQGHGSSLYIPDNPKITHVTSLEDSGEGTLRQAIENHDGTPTFIEFDVGGYIDLNTPIKIMFPYLYTLGETAPNPGITIRRDPNSTNKITSLLQLPYRSQAHDLLFRHLRLRHGDNYPPNPSRDHGMLFQGGYNVVIDHCSFSWTPDDMLNIWLHTNSPWEEMYNFTIQNSLFSVSLRNHPTGLKLSGSDEKYLNIHDMTLHHNVFATISHRCPRLTTGEVINNIVYNWGDRIGGTIRSGTVDFIGNYFKEGPMKLSDPIKSLPNSHLLRREIWSNDPNNASIHSSDNYLDGYMIKTKEADYNFWMERILETDQFHPLDDSIKREERLPQSDVPVKIEPSSDLMNTLLPVVGAVLPKRDSVDIEIIKTILDRTGPTELPENMEELGGWPSTEEL